MSQQQVNDFPSFFLKGGCVAAALFFCGVSLPGPAMAVGFNDDPPPETTETTTDCAEGTVWDAATEACVTPENASGDQATLFDMARELAYAGRLDDAERVLARLDDADQRLTYTGFIARKNGDWPKAEASYRAAIARNPNNFLARSYYGQGLVARGDIAAAEAQLGEIRARGGRMTWPAVALRLTLESGHSGY